MFGLLLLLFLAPAALLGLLAPGLLLLLLGFVLLLLFPFPPNAKNLKPALDVGLALVLPVALDGLAPVAADPGRLPKLLVRPPMLLFCC